LRPGRLRLLLLAGGASLRAGEGFLHHRARKTARLLEQLHTANWKPSPNTDADEQCEFCYQPEDWGKTYRFIALRSQQRDKVPADREQYQLFDTPEYSYRVFVTDMQRPIDLLRSEEHTSELQSHH